MCLRYFVVVLSVFQLVHCFSIEINSQSRVARNRILNMTELQHIEPDASENHDTAEATGK